LHKNATSPVRHGRPRRLDYLQSMLYADFEVR
jgi:hypothetical protein